MTERVTNHTGRRLATVAAGLAAGLAGMVLATAGPAAADVPEGWPESDPVDPWFVIGVLAGIPLLIALLLAAFVYLPAMVRGERVAPGAPSVEDQWLGGPRKDPAELEARSDESVDADAGTGGAGGRW